MTLPKVTTTELNTRQISHLDKKYFLPTSLLVSHVHGKNQSTSSVIYLKETVNLLHSLSSYNNWDNGFPFTAAGMNMFQMDDDLCYVGNVASNVDHTNGTVSVYLSADIPRGKKTRRTNPQHILLSSPSQSNWSFYLSLFELLFL